MHFAQQKNGLRAVFFMPSTNLQPSKNPLCAGLLAKAGCQLAMTSTDTPRSRASPLPQDQQLREALSRLVFARLEIASHVGANKIDDLLHGLKSLGILIRYFNVKFLLYRHNQFDRIY